LREATAQDADASPMAIIHSSYYAMFHAARAILFQVTGRARSGTTEQFSSSDSWCGTSTMRYAPPARLSMRSRTSSRPPTTRRSCRHQTKRAIALRVVPTRNWAAPQDIMVCPRDQPQIGTRHCRISECHHRVDPCAIRTDVNVPDQGSWCRKTSYSVSCCRWQQKELRT
jgi:hypothetical protein